MNTMSTRILLQCPSENKYNVHMKMITVTSENNYNVHMKVITVTLWK